MHKNPYGVIHSKHVTEKTTVLEGLHAKKTNRSLQKCVTPKYVFIVDKRANKREIAEAIEKIYVKNQVRVIKVNTLLTKPKKRRVRGRTGMKAGFKKAIVTLRAEDKLGEKV
jgi:large subunit ribosomal protein L23